MIRRRFLGLVTLAGAGGLTTFSAATRRHGEQILFHVEGFTCITCAVGLETLLLREAGVIAARATYPEGLATVTYDPHATSKEALVTAIESMGFHAREAPSPQAS